VNKVELLQSALKSLTEVAELIIRAHGTSDNSDVRSDLNDGLGHLLGGMEDVRLVMRLTYDEKTYGETSEPEVAPQ
jgi:hypothetical protein